MADLQQEDETSSVPTFFKEHRELFDLLDKVLASTGDEATWRSASGGNGMVSATESTLIRDMSEILGRYQEQPTCLDPHLERIISQLMSLAQRYVYAFHDSLPAGSADAVSAQRMSGIFGLVYLLCKVRGYKVVLRFFPHEVADIEPVFATLWYHTAKPDGRSWTTRYVLLIWLSLLAMIPFDIESIDSGMHGLPALEPADAEANMANMSLVKKWVALGKVYLRRPGCEMEGAAVMLSRLLSRKDTVQDLQPAFLQWA
ncbi:hypothetical protein EC988_009502, partial [Linderina pennispora]